jgi:hypothetical protein
MTMLFIGPVAHSCCHPTRNQLAHYDNYAIITKGILTIIGITPPTECWCFRAQGIVLDGLACLVFKA